jgi:hypothetical protein
MIIYPFDFKRFRNLNFQKYINNLYKLNFQKYINNTDIFNKLFEHTHHYI